MNEHRDINGNGHEQEDGTAEDAQSSKQVMSQKEDTVSDNVKSSDEPSGARRWKTFTVSFLSGALVTFAFMYFWIGNQNDVVAVVNGDEITQKEFIESAVSGGGAHLLDQLILEKIIQQKAEQENVTISDKELDHKFNEFKEQIPSEDMFENYLEQQGLSEDVFLEQMKTDLLLEKLFEPNIKVSDEEVRQYFDENKEQFNEPEQVKAKQIVVESEEEARKAYKRLKDGEDFSKVTQDVSIDQQTRDNGGDLGSVPKGRLAVIDPELEEKVFALKKGEFIEPFETQTGFYIVQVDEKIAAKKATFNDEIAKEIREELKQRKLYEKMPEWIEDLRREADVENRLIPEDDIKVTKG